MGTKGKLGIALLFAVACFAAGMETHAYLRGPDREIHHYTEKVRVDTLHHGPVFLPVPGPEHTRVETLYHEGKATVVYVPSPPDTVYADCDSAHRYDSEYSDSLVKIKVKSDICGRLLASQISYECYRRTITRTLTPESRSRYALYAVANTHPGLGMQIAAPKWTAGYSYQFGNTPGLTAHQITLGIHLKTFSRK